MIRLFKQAQPVPVHRLKPVATLRYNGTVYYTLDNKGGYIVSGKDKMAIMQHTKEQGFSIDTRQLRRA